MNEINRKEQIGAFRQCNNEIKWLFFDIGSTLVDETDCYKQRYTEAIENTDITFEELEKKVIEFSKQNRNGDHPAIEYFNLTLPKWHKELEKLYPDTKMVLSALSKKYKLGIIANQSFGTEQRLKAWNILDYFDIIISSAEEGVSKPDVRIFELAMEKADCTADNAVMIGDRIDNDIVPAKKLGMKTIWIKQGFARYQTPRDSAQTADCIVEKLSQLLEIL